MASIDSQRLTIKLNAIRAKNLSEIMALNTYIPFLPVGYTLEELQTWLNDRITVLEYCRDRPIAQVTALAEQRLNLLCTADRVTGNAIMTGQPYTMAPCGRDDYLRLCTLVLYKWVYIP